MNNANITMSDFQKIIFVNNVDESSIQDNILKNQNYNFAVFFANTKDENPSGFETAFNSKHLINVWYNGQRLNRFIGVNEDSCMVTLEGGHVVKLLFDYQSGLLSLVDANKLQNMQIIAYSFNSKQGSPSKQFIGSNGKFSNNKIDARDNKFNLYIKFTADNNDQTILNSISPNISITSLYSNIKITNVKKYDREADSTLDGWSGSVGSDEIVYIYTFEILQDTYNKTNGLSLDDLNQFNIDFISDYDRSKKSTVQLYTVLNPTSFNVSYNGSKINDGEVFIYGNSQSTILQQRYKIDILPQHELNKPFDYYSHPLTFTITATNVNDTNAEPFVKIKSKVAGSNEESWVTNLVINAQEIDDTEFTLGIFNTANNITQSTNIDVTINYNDYPYLTEKKRTLSYQIKTVGNQNSKYYYLSTENPALMTNFSINLLKSYQDLSIGDLIYDWDPDLGVTLQDESNLITELNHMSGQLYDKYLYVMIPMNEDIHIKYNVWEDNPSYSNGKYYLPIQLGSLGSQYLFNLINQQFYITTDDGQQLYFKIYKCKYPGVFHGKIQIDSKS